MAKPMTSDAGLAASACPHLVVRDALGPGMTADLLQYVAARQADFVASVVRSRETGERRVDYGVRNCVSLPDLGPFRAPFEAFVRGTIPAARAQLAASETALEPKDFEIVAYRDGNSFAAHIDTNEKRHKVRVLSCVYYFAAAPRRFRGGELRVYGMPTLSAAKTGQVPFVDVMPETDSMIIFPSWLRHEVLPVQVPSGDWPDSRFTLNCWLHRAAPSAQASAS
jgi:SM-20-related protein